MVLEAVWFKNGEEICKVFPVMNIVCYEDMESISEIEINNGYGWYSCDDADNFAIRIKEELVGDNNDDI